MAATGNATPLIALDAVVIDTETTGLDPARARVIEIAAVRLAAGRIDADKPFRSLVRPAAPIPETATAIHGIDAAKVADAPLFDDIWPKLADFAADGVVIGHTIGFDLAVLKRECERAGIAWRRPRTLDTRLLAEVAAPDLPGYSLDVVAAWLGVEITDRHSALGDAMTTARIFRALVPKLRDGGIRTLAEAMAACRALTDVLEQQHRAGWIEPVTAPSRVDSERTLARIDTFPYRHRVRDVMSAPAKFTAADTPVNAALARMASEKISSLFVFLGKSDKPPRPMETGIVTERDVLRVLSEHGGAALGMPVEKVMSQPLATVPAEAFVYLAIGRMSRMGIRHLGVTDEAGTIVGALSARDLLRLRAGEAVSLGDEIDQAEDVHGLVVAWGKLPQVTASLVAEGVGAGDIAAVISRQLGSLTRQAALLAERRMRSQGLGEPPCDYALAVLGSAGRGESLLAMDQDNALIFAKGEPGGREDRWFATLGTHVADILHEVGVRYCPGGVMAKNPQWRGSLATWQARIAEWITRSHPEDLLAVDIFFDMRGVHGDAGLVDQVWRAGFDAARGDASFAKLLAEAAGEPEAGLNWFGGLRTKEGRIDLKKVGLFRIVTFARVLAIRHHVVERSTPARLDGIKALGLGAESDIDALAEAQAVFLNLILAQQIDDIEHGRPTTNAVLVKRLNAGERERLHTALKAVRPIEELTRDLLFKE